MKITTNEIIAFYNEYLKYNKIIKSVDLKRNSFTNKDTNGLGCYFRSELINLFNLNKNQLEKSKSLFIKNHKTNKIEVNKIFI